VSKLKKVVNPFFDFYVMLRKIIEKGSDFEIDKWKPFRILSKRKMQSEFAF